MPETGRDARWAQVQARARCARDGTDPDLWFPVSATPDAARAEAAAALEICRACTVRRPCLELSLSHWDIGQHGIWGGLVPAERAAIRRAALSGLAGEQAALGRTA